MRLFTASVATSLLAGAAASAFAADVMAPKDIQASFFNGQPFTASTPSNVKYKMTATADGKLTREPVGKAGVKGEGTWKLSKDGFCTTWKGSKSNCFRLLAGNNRWSVMAGSTLLAVWTK